MRSSGVSLSIVPTHQPLCRCIGESRSGFVSEQELLVGLTTLASGAPEDRLRLCFMTADAGHDGRVVKQELIKLLKSCYSLLPPERASAQGSEAALSGSAHAAVGSDAWVESRYGLMPRKFRS